MEGSYYEALVFFVSCPCYFAFCLIEYNKDGKGIKSDYMRLLKLQVNACHK